jgi:hypothetical protein
MTHSNPCSGLSQGKALFILSRGGHVKLRQRFLKLVENMTALLLGSGRVLTRLVR